MGMRHNKQRGECSHAQYPANCIGFMPPFDKEGEKKVLVRVGIQ